MFSNWLDIVKDFLCGSKRPHLDDTQENFRVTSSSRVPNGVSYLNGSPPKKLKPNEDFLGAQKNGLDLSRVPTRTGLRPRQTISNYANVMNSKKPQKADARTVNQLNNGVSQWKSPDVRLGHEHRFLSGAVGINQNGSAFPSPASAFRSSQNSDNDIECLGAWPAYVNQGRDRTGVPAVCPSAPSGRSNQPSKATVKFEDVLRDHRSIADSVRRTAFTIPHNSNTRNTPISNGSKAGERRLSQPTQSYEYANFYQNGHGTEMTVLQSDYSSRMQERIRANNKLNQTSVDFDDDRYERFVSAPSSPKLISYKYDIISKNSAEKAERIAANKPTPFSETTNVNREFEDIYRRGIVPYSDERKDKIYRELTERAKLIVDEDVDYIPLNSDQDDAVNNAFAGGSPTQVFSDAFRLQIMRKDLHTLKGLNWLNDEVANFFLEMIVDRSSRYPNVHPKVYTFNTFFYPQLASKGYASLRRWTKKVDIFSYDMVLVPVHLSAHWCLAVIDFKDKAIRYFDSLGHNNAQCFQLLRMYLEEEKKDKQKGSMDWEDWSFHTEDTIPQQKNMCDCGIFMLKFADFVSRGKQITFSQENMPYFRRRICYEILDRKLLFT